MKKLKKLEFKRLKDSKNFGIYFAIEIDDLFDENNPDQWYLQICPFSKDWHQHFLLNMSQTKKLHKLLNQILEEEKKFNLNSAQ